MGKKEPKEPKKIPGEVEAVKAAVAPFMEVLAHRKPGDHLTESQEDAVLGILSVVEGNINRAARLTGLSTSTVFAVLNRRTADYQKMRAEWKQRTVIGLQYISSLLMEKMAETVETDDTSLRDLFVAFGIITQRGMDLAGEGPTVKHEHSHKPDQDAIDQAKLRIREIMQPGSVVRLGDDEVKTEKH